MKKIIPALLVLVVLMGVLTGCGCMGSDATVPTTMPMTDPTSHATHPEHTHAPETTYPEAPSTAMTEAATTETTQPLTKESGRVKSHIDGNF